MKRGDFERSQLSRKRLPPVTKETGVGSENWTAGQYEATVGHINVAPSTLNSNVYLLGIRSLSAHLLLHDSIDLSKPVSALQQLIDINTSQISLTDTDVDSMRQ